MNEHEFKSRTKNLSLRVIRLVESLPNNLSANVIGKQLLRSVTSAGANYRAACRAKSTAGLINKISIVEEESDESLYWLEISAEPGLVAPAKLVELKKDMNEIVSMIVASIRTLRSRNSQIQNLKSL